MADPKYANLPGIDTESRDVYECGDLPEEDQNPGNEEDSTSVELVDSKASFERFSGKYVSGFGKDFSIKSTGYEAGGYGLAMPGEQETIIQRLNRLKIEVSELSRDVGKLQQSKTNRINALDMSKQVDTLQAQLDGIRLDEIDGTTLSADLNMEEIIANLQAEGKPKDALSGSQLGSYQLYLKPGQKEKQMLRVANLEQRIARLEKVLGPDSPIYNVLTSQTDGSLQETVCIMETKLSLLDPEQLPQVDSRLQAILTKVNEINKAHKSSGEERSEVNKQIAGLFDLVQKWEGVRGSLPLIVERLKALDTLHSKSADFTATLSHLESVQSRITSQLDSANAAHKKLGGMLKENLEIVEGNVAQLNKRLSDLNA